MTANDGGDARHRRQQPAELPGARYSPGGIQGTLNSRPVIPYTVEYFISENCDPSGNGEGESLVGSVSVTTDGAGNATLPFFPIGAGVLVTATATSATGDTSEFSNCVAGRVGARARGQRRSRSERECRRYRAAQWHGLERSRLEPVDLSLGLRRAALGKHGDAHRTPPRRRRLSRPIFPVCTPCVWS